MIEYTGDIDRVIRDQCPSICPQGCPNYRDCNGCPACGGDDLKTESGINGDIEICVDCGTVIGEVEAEYA